MDDKIGYMAELQKDILQEINAILGTKLETFDQFTTFSDTLPKDIRKLQDLCLFLEREFLSCANAKAYFSGCLSGAAMVEALLLLLCWLNKDEVSATSVYKKHAKTRGFDEVWGSLNLESLMEIAETLRWIPADLVKAELSQAIALGYEEIAIAKGLNEEAITSGKQALLLHPATALFGLVRDLRNCLHAGRWIRQNKAFNAAPFEEWSHLGVILIAEIRDCLAIKFTKDMQMKLSDAKAKFEAAIARFHETVAAKAKS